MTTSSVVSDFNSSVNALVKSIFEAFEAGELRTVGDLKLMIRQRFELLSDKVNEQISKFEQRLDSNEATLPRLSVCKTLTYVLFVEPFAQPPKPNPGRRYRYRGPVGKAKWTVLPHSSHVNSKGTKYVTN